MRLRHPALCDKIDKTQSGRQAHGRQKRLQGIALILFGILLCLAEEEINRELFHSIGYFPFALIGAITGIAGLVMVFYAKKDDAGK